MSDNLVLLTLRTVCLKGFADGSVNNVAIAEKINVFSGRAAMEEVPQETTLFSDSGLEKIKGESKTMLAY